MSRFSWSASVAHRTRAPRTFCTPAHLGEHWMFGCHASCVLCLLGFAPMQWLPGSSDPIQPQPGDMSWESQPQCWATEVSFQGEPRFAGLGGGFGPHRLVTRGSVFMPSAAPPSQPTLAMVNGRRGMFPLGVLRLIPRPKALRESGYPMSSVVTRRSTPPPSPSLARGIRSRGYELCHQLWLAAFAVCSGRQPPASMVGILRHDCARCMWYCSAPLVSNTARALLVLGPSPPYTLAPRRRRLWPPSEGGDLFTLVVSLVASVCRGWSGGVCQLAMGWAEVSA